MDPASFLSAETQGSLVLALVGGAAWLIQRYLAYWVWRFSKWDRAEDMSTALRSEIETLIEGYEEVFTNDTLNVTLNKLRQLKKSGTPRPLLLADSSSKVVFDVVKADITALPKEVIADIVSFYTEDDLFAVCYALQGTDLFARCEIGTQIKTVQEVHESAADCVVSGRKAIESIDSFLSTQKSRRTNVFLWHGLGMTAIGLPLVKIVIDRLN